MYTYLGTYGSEVVQEGDSDFSFFISFMCAFPRTSDDTRDWAVDVILEM